MIYNYPKVSLILTTFNSIFNFKKTYSSIIIQDYPNIEIIIVDGKSTDGTVEAISKFAADNDNIKWISEVDKGIYDAMNKGLYMATGEYILFFNDIFSGCLPPAPRQYRMTQLQPVFSKDTATLNCHIK